MLAEEGFVHHADGQWNWTQRVLSGRRGQPAVGVVGQLRGRRHDARRAGDRRDRLHQRPVDAAREGDLHRRRAAVPGGAARLRRPQGVRALGGLRLLHRRDHLYEGDDPGYVRVRSRGSGEAGAGSREPRPGRRSWPRAAPASHGEVHVVSRVVGFKKIKFYTNENVGSGELDLPEQQMHTSSYWLTIPAAVMAALPFGGDDRRDGVVGLAFAMKNVAQLLLMCDGHDIGLSVDGGASNVRRGPAARGRARSARRRAAHLHLRQLSGRHRIQPAAVRHAPALLERTRDLIDGCPCASGLSVVRRPRREHRAARQAGRLADSCSACSAAAATGAPL